MAILRSHDEDEYFPDASTLAVRCSWDHIRADGIDPEEYRPDQLEQFLSSTFASTGYGWLEAKAASDEYSRVRLEAHDCAPTLALDFWDDIAELPYGATSGWVGLGHLDDFGEAHLRLGPPGLYRVRVHRRPADDEGDIWLLQFWPDTPAAPPAWLRRTPGDYWLMDAYVAADLVLLVRWSPDQTVHASARDLAAQLLVAPDLVVDGLQAATDPESDRPGLDVTGEMTDLGALLTLTLRHDPDDENDDSDEAFTNWEPEDSARGPAVGPSVGVAYVLAPGATWDESMVPARPRSRAPRQPRPVSLPWGPPPRAGFVTPDQVVVVTRDGAPYELATLPWPRRGHGNMVWQSAVGLVAVGPGGKPMLIDASGDVSEICEPSGHVKLDPTGRHMAVHEAHRGRRSWVRLHLVDLLTRVVQTLECDEEDSFELVCVLDGGVCFNERLTAHSLLWKPGSAPVSLPYRVEAADPVTRARLVRNKQDGPLRMLDTAGRERPLHAKYGTLAPGAGRIAQLGERPRGVKVWTPPDAAAPAVLKLPKRTTPSRSGPWEDADHLLVEIHLDPEDRYPTPVRVHTGTGEFERVTLGLDFEPGELDFVRPLHLPVGRTNPSAPPS